LVDGTPFADILHSTAGADLIRGRVGGDRLWGLAGDDDLHGGHGADVLVGGPGLDRMTGGAGADRFVLRQSESAPPNGPAYDEILDFSRAQHDRIDLEPIDARIGADGNQSFSLVGDNAFTHADSSGSRPPPTATSWSAATSTATWTPTLPLSSAPV
jgi:Ca2+-binding RTX toxin-like protein